MFDDKQIEAYKSIKAPDMLYTKIKAKRTRYPIAAVAACLICFFALGIFLMPRSEMKVNGISMNNKLVLNTVSRTKSIDTVLNISLDVKEKTEITVSGGYLSLDEIECDKLTLSQDTEFLWITGDNELPAYITISDEKGVKTFTLIYEDSQYILKKEK